MSFSAKVKDELSKIQIEDNAHIIAELSGFLRMCGTIKIKKGLELQVFFTTENASVARRIVTFLKRLYSNELDLLIQKNHQLKKNTNYSIHLKDEGAVRLLLDETGFIQSENVFNPEYKMDPGLLQDPESVSAYIRACFLGSGSISNPDRSYHMEFVTSRPDHGQDLIFWLKKFAFEARLINRKDLYVVYIKDAETISDVLAFMGAGQAVLSLESTRVMKEVRNKVNRQVNCETANLAKLVKASMRQVEDIRYLDQKLGLEKLDPALLEVAKFRLENPEASLQEIGDGLDPKVPKSSVNRRIKKIHQLAEELKGDEK